MQRQASHTSGSDHRSLQATRGGRVKLATITAPEMDYSHEEKGDALHAMEVALAMERLNLQVSQVEGIVPKFSPSTSAAERSGRESS